jgi:hypothetical protein
MKDERSPKKKESTVTGVAVGRKKGKRKATEADAIDVVFISDDSAAVIPVCLTWLFLYAKTTIVTHVVYMWFTLHYMFFT